MYARMYMCYFSKYFYYFDRIYRGEKLSSLACLRFVYDPVPVLAYIIAWYVKQTFKYNF